MANVSRVECHRQEVTYAKVSEAVDMTKVLISRNLLNFAVFRLTFVIFRHTLLESSLIEENAYLRGRIDQLNDQLSRVNDEIRDLRADNNELIVRTKIMSQDKDNLAEEVGRLRMASQSSQPQVESDLRPSKTSKSKSKARTIRNTEDDDDVEEVEHNSDAARVCLY